MYFREFQLGLENIKATEPSPPASQALYNLSIVPEISLSLASYSLTASGALCHIPGICVCH